MIALWHIDSDTSILKSEHISSGRKLQFKSKYSMISTGTERLVASGSVDAGFQEFHSECVFFTVFRYIDFDLAERLRECGTDLVILEGMGRAIHTNFLASFSCDCIKSAVIKNRWLATRLGGDMFSVVFKYEPRYTSSCPSIHVSDNSQASCSFALNHDRTSGAAVK